MDMIKQPADLLEQERAENDARYIKDDVCVQLPTLPVHSKDWNLWIHYVGSLAGKQVLDVGCGSGLNTVGFGVLHHLPPQEFGQSLKAVLKLGGYAIFENSNANPLYRLARRIRNDETAGGDPLTGEEAQILIREVGMGAQIYPRFGLFGLVKKYMFRSSRLFACLLGALDKAIGTISGACRWSAYMWVEVRKPVE
jgi:hypothetical protein